MMPHIHYLYREVIKGRGGWICIKELPENFYGGDTCFVVPYKPFGEYFDQYRIDCMKYHGQGNWGPLETFAVYTNREGKRPTFIADIHGHKIEFKERISRQVKYIGKLKHPDFRFFLGELDHEVDKLDELLTQTSYAVIGCRFGEDDAIKSFVS